MRIKSRVTTLCGTCVHSTHLSARRCSAKVAPQVYEHSDEVLEGTKCGIGKGGGGFAI